VKPDILVGGASAALGYGVLKERNLEGYLSPVEGGLSPVTSPPEPPSDKAGKAPSEPSDEERADADGTDLDLGMSRDVPTDPETGADDALKVGYRVAVGTYSKAMPVSKTGSAKP
jgi:hypothetical protein